MAENYIDKIEVDGVERPIRDTSIAPSATTPKAPGTAVVGNEEAYARGDHVHPKEVSDAERTAWNGKGSYSKPSGGIPKADLAAAVQAVLDDAVLCTSQVLTDAQRAQARTNIGAGDASKAVVVALSLPAAAWTAAGDNYTQTVVISGSTANSKIDLQPDAAAIAQLIDDGVSALYVSNTGGTLTAFAVGGKPGVDLTVQASRTEVAA